MTRGLHGAPRRAGLRPRRGGAARCAACAGVLLRRVWRVCERARCGARQRVDCIDHAVYAAEREDAERA
eukprot:4569739-Prymnesium_polylepis.2